MTKPRMALAFGVLALLGAGLWFALKQPVPVSPGKPGDPARPQPANAERPAGAEVARASAKPQPSPVVPPRVSNLASLPHPAETVVPVAPAVKTAAALPVGHPEVVTPGTKSDYLRDLDTVRLMLRDYRSIMGDNPVGSNAEIMKSLMGGNPKRAQLGPPGGQGINASGELVDRWGTPYFFHQMSATTMEIRSAGPDKIMYTADDVMLR